MVIAICIKCIIDWRVHFLFPDSVLLCLSSVGGGYSRRVYREGVPCQAVKERHDRQSFNEEINEFV